MLSAVVVYGLGMCLAACHGTNSHELTDSGFVFLEYQKALSETVQDWWLSILVFSECSALPVLAYGFLF